MTTKLRCIHRHTIESHPNCFNQVLAPRPDWWRNKRIAYFDIEVSNLNANFGFMLSWCIKYRGSSKIIHSIITKKEIFNGTFDRRVVKELLDELNNVDILVGYYSTRFDVPFTRARSMYLGYEFPGFREKYHWDLYYHVRRLFKISNKKLATITAFLDIEGKTPLTSPILLQCQYGDRDSLRYLLEHNRQDVLILERLHNKLWEQTSWIRTSV